MSRLIDADALMEEVNIEIREYMLTEKGMRSLIRNAPTIDAVEVVRCKDCKWEWTKKCPPHRMGLIHDASDYCSYGIRKTDGADKHDEAVEALGHLIKRMKGADDE